MKSQNNEVFPNINEISTSRDKIIREKLQGIIRLIIP